MLQRLLLAYALLLSQQATQAQNLDVTKCIGELTAATACNSYQSILSSCNSFKGSQAAACYCPQTVLNAIAGCQSEFRVCAEGYQYDSEFQGSNGIFGLWHSACDGVLTYKPTTPAVTSLSLTFDPNNCLSAESYCQRFGDLTDACTASSASDLQNCLCRTAVLDLASRCQVDGSISCLFRTPTTTNLYSYKQCGASKASAPSTRSATVTTTQAAVTSQVSISISTVQPTSSPTSSVSVQTKTATSFGQRAFRCSQTSLIATGLVVLFFALS